MASVAERVGFVLEKCWVRRVRVSRGVFVGRVFTNWERSFGSTLSIWERKT